MNTPTKILTLLILLSAVPNVIRTKENKITTTKAEKIHILDIKNQRSLFLGALGLISGYMGTAIIKNGIEVPFYNLCSYNKSGESCGLHRFIFYSIGSTPTILSGSALLYLGYKLITNNIKQDSPEEATH